MISTDATSARNTKQSLDQALRPVHSNWVEQTRRALEPALVPDADSWARWDAVRYLADGFMEQLGWERALVGELRPFVPPGTGERLVSGGDQVSRLRLEIDRVGRRRGSPTDFAAPARRLLDRLGLWCAEIELAAAGIPREELPPEGAVVLDHLQGPSGTLPDRAERCCLVCG